MTNYALVSGASRGIGRAIATDLSRRDFSVIATARDETSLHALIPQLAGSSHHIVVADLSEPEGAEELARQVTSIVGSDGLRAFVHCAAQTPDPEAEATLESTGLDVMRGHVAVTAFAGALLLKALKSSLSVPERSHAILLSSDWTIDGTSGPPVFAAAKSFVAEVWRQSSKEYLQSGIILSTIIAGNVASYDLDWSSPKWSLDDSIQEVTAELGISRVSLKDVASAVRFVLDAPLAAVTQIRIIPLDPQYVP